MVHENQVEDVDEYVYLALSSIHPVTPAMTLTQMAFQTMGCNLYNQFVGYYPIRTIQHLHNGSECQKN